MIKAGSIRLKQLTKRIKIEPLSQTFPFQWFVLMLLSYKEGCQQANIDCEYVSVSEWVSEWVGEWASEWTEWLLPVTFNDISVIYVMAHRCAGGLQKKLDIRSGSRTMAPFGDPGVTD